MKKRLLFSKHMWVFFGIVACILVVGIIIAKTQLAQAKDEFFQVEAHTVSSRLSITGKVKPAQAVNLGFIKGGIIVSVPKQSGDHVVPGDILVQLSKEDILTRLIKAKAQVKIEQAHLSETLLVASTTSNKTATSSQNIIKNAEVALQQAAVSAVDSIYTKIDPLFINPRSSTPVLLFDVTYGSTSSLETGRVEVERRLSSLKNITATSTLYSNEVQEEVKRDLGEIRLFLDNIALAVNAATTSPSISKSTLDQWKTSIALAQSQVNNSITLIFTTEDALNQQTTDTKKAYDIQELISAKARVQAAEASVTALNAELAKTTLKSPIKGVITVQNAREGEIAGDSTSLVSISSDSEFQIESFISEKDISKVKSGQEVDVILDAYGSDVPLKAIVVSIDSSETVFDKEAMYKTTFQFEGADDRIKSGMTASIENTGEIHQGVIAVPERAIINRNTLKFVRIKKDTTIDEIEVKTGLRSDDGTIEITNGLSLGDIVLVNHNQ